MYDEEFAAQIIQHILPTVWDRGCARECCTVLRERRLMTVPLRVSEMCHTEDRFVHTRPHTRPVGPQFYSTPRSHILPRPEKAEPPPAPMKPTTPKRRVRRELFKTAGQIEVRHIL